MSIPRLHVDGILTVEQANLSGNHYLIPIGEAEGSGFGDCFHVTIKVASTLGLECIVCIIFEGPRLYAQSLATGSARTSINSSSRVCGRFPGDGGSRSKQSSP